MKVYCVMFNDQTIIKAASNRQLKNSIRIQRELMSNCHVIKFWKERETK